MITTQIYNFAYQTRLALHLTHRDQIKRLSGLMLVLCVCYTFGNHSAAYFWSGVVVTAELILHAVNRKVKITGPQMPHHIAVASWSVNWLMLSIQLIPAISLAQSGSVPLLVLALIWLFSLFSHVSNTYASLPIHHAMLIATILVVTLICFGVAAMATGGGAQWLHWAIAGLALLVYIFNTFAASAQHKQVMLDLDSARRQADKRLFDLEFLNNHDALTGLLSRRAFEEEATANLPRPGRSETSTLTYILLDLDGFKPINDSYSHSAGDAVLIGVSDRLKRFVGKRGIVARVGGDEFAIAMYDITDNNVAIKFGEELAALIEQPIIYEQLRLSVGSSVGIAMSNTLHDTIPALASGADQAMYQAKGDPSRNAILFDRIAFPKRPSLDDRAMIKRAMLKHQIEPYFQPKVCLTTGEIRGFEALSRWRHPKRGLLLPAKFLPSINELGLQGEFLLHTTELVLKQVTEMLDEGLDPGQVSVNVPEVALATLSGRSEVLNLINRYPAARAQITFEVTEDVFIARSGNIIQESIAIFRRAGVRISLDDFGTGFASFKHLRELEFDELKLDTAFVRDVGKKHDADVLVQGFLNIGKGLGVTVIAEGIETQQQLAILRRMGCKLAQGFLFGKAQPIEESKLLLRAQARKQAAKSALRGSAA
jgi:diguanylate cyclase (GGDEF)-like protein